jgi:hypothetical protein
MSDRRSRKAKRKGKDCTTSPFGGAPASLVAALHEGPLPVTGRHARRVPYKRDRLLVERRWSAERRDRARRESK